jgi:hypothetical protein
LSKGANNSQKFRVCHYSSLSTLTCVSKVLDLKYLRRLKRKARRFRHLLPKFRHVSRSTEALVSALGVGAGLGTGAQLPALVYILAHQTFVHLRMCYFLSKECNRCRVGDPDPDPQDLHVFRPLGSGSFPFLINVLSGLKQYLQNYI